jgi:hypothetical protein
MTYTVVKSRLLVAGSVGWLSQRRRLAPYVRTRGPIRGSWLARTSSLCSGLAANVPGAWLSWPPCPPPIAGYPAFRDMPRSGTGLTVPQWLRRASGAQLRTDQIES